MNDERIEALLRDWLAAEAQRSRPPLDLRARVGLAHPPEPVRSRFRWPLSRPMIGVTAALAVVLIAALTLSLLGVTPLGRADCSAVTIDTVRQAVSQVPAYTYHLVGTEEVASPILPFPTAGEVSYTYETMPFDLRGWYAAPDSWRVEVVQGADPHRPRTPVVWLFIDSEWDGFAVEDGVATMRRPGSGTWLTVTDDAELWGDMRELLLGLEANQLSGVLAGEPYRSLTPGEEPIAQPLSWQVEAIADGCRLVSANADYQAISGAIWQLEVVVDPETQLPREVLRHIFLPSVPDREFSWQLTYDYGGNGT